MSTHCLHCGKRLGFFHNKKQPYCSDVHQERYLEDEAQRALSRLREEYPDAAIQAPAVAAEPVAPALLSELKPAEEFEYPEMPAPLFEDQEEPEQPGYVPYRLDATAPETAVIRSTSPVHLSVSPSPLDSRRGVLSFEAAGIIWQPVTVTQDLPSYPELQPEPELGPLLDLQLRPAMRPMLGAGLAQSLGWELPRRGFVLPGPPAAAPVQPPGPVTSSMVVPRRIRPAELVEAAPVRVFCEPSLPLALLHPALPEAPRVIATIFLDSLADARGSELTLVDFRENLPRPEPLRLRTFGALRGPEFPPAHVRVLRSA